MKNKKYIFRVTFKGFVGFILVFLLGCIWMFWLGIYVGRSTVPVKFDIKDIKDELVSLKKKDIEGKTIRQTPNIPAKKDDLHFYETLKENKRIKKSDTGISKPATGKKDMPVEKPNENRTRFTIQVSSMKDEAAAEKMVDELKRDGYAAYKTNVKIPDLGAWFRVRVGHFRSKDQATSAMEGLKKRNFKPILLQE